MRRRSLVAMLAMPALARAQPAWPSRPIRMVIPFPPGGTTDILGRYLAPPLAAALGQSVVVENRTGGNGAVGVVETLRAAPDGYTICLSISTLITQALLTKQPYDPIADVTPILHLANVGNILVVNKALPIHSVADLIAHARAHPGMLAYGSPGIGSSVHLSGELFAQATGTQMVHVPYRGGGPALADLVAGNIQLMFGNASSTLPFVRSDAVRPLAVTAATRQAYAPDLPTIAEVALPGFAVSEWYAFLGPAGMPAPIVERLNREIMAIVGTPEGRAKLLDLGAEVVGGTPAGFAAFLRADMARTEALIRSANIRAE
ncbi:Bug family tripartite tricarboxylate transporter substrate binding protein [Paracraurococcus lichenis]|uniref:Tripartite tricarboxylate transporter substrate binding protein n=1 Tax=Paracraurococcus lichenis TaxID=3064888 RepID=A0ABT9DXB1_9PROT|nr:tripartite tricarboxylate transporter substrate binding protein [Paracraurococcus sp. LOR1-02]MDO9708542.1 tripartite tricarboxylate transporter substrate binding protein [Paracraurococcus sp. LOR1-02]